MMQNSHDVKGKILEEVKKLASDIASVQSTVGLITNYQKVQALYEKVAFLKILTEESIEIHQRKNELEAMIEANPTHDKSEEALEKEREVRAAYETDEATDEAPEEISEITHEEEPPIASEEKENVIVPKTENIIENNHSEEEDYVNTLEENQPETNDPEITHDEAEQPEEVIASVQEEPVAESEEYKKEATEISEDGDHEEMKPVSEKAEETIEQPETTAEIKEPEIYTEELFAPEPSETHKMTEEELASHKVKLASIKGLKPIVREQIAEENPATEESIKAGDNAAFTPVNASASVQVGQFRLDLNDRMAFLKKLFNNDDGEMKIVLEKLNEFQTLDEAKEFLSDIYYDKDWKSADEYAQRLWSLVESRFR
ncbi:hypothetical protein ACV0BM_008930 [Elizabethkingia meningoseptica]